jgi:NAD-dependent deacetylase
MNRERKNLVVLSGAGISRESGLQTFRDGDGLWEGYDVQQVATPEAWERSPSLVRRFYDERRKAVLEAEPNLAHQVLVSLEESFRVVIITQNIDDLHERAGSSHVLHLHGEILKAQSSVDASLVYPIDGPHLSPSAVCQHGHPLRPHVVWFGEPVPMMEVASAEAQKADIFVVVGTSLTVYPAAELIEHIPATALLYCVDPVIPTLSARVASRVKTIEEPASRGLAQLNDILALEVLHS